MKQVIACIDGATRTPGICDYAIWAAGRLDADLDFLHVTEKTPDYLPLAELTGNVWLGTHESLRSDLTDLERQREDLLQEQGRQCLQMALERARSLGATRIAAKQRQGNLLDVLLDIEADARLLVLGHHEHPVKASRLLPDHRLESAVRGLHRPIMVAGAVFKEPVNFMVAYDGSPTADKTADMVSRSPLLAGLPAHLVMVGRTCAAAQAALERTRVQLTRAGFAVQAVPIPGEPAQALADYAEEHGIDLLVMGAYGHGRIRHLMLGSTTTAILGQLRMPLLILR
ncbi:universal stress protein [Bordetella sp. FB-8]|uniref:universal stress protein n=1 Tax=Bordetella sp. FB-8 TaxID=1159870 RepID=UPI000363D220|nr:universal stress protein [Bordetella sp. FB-8]